MPDRIRLPGRAGARGPGSGAEPQQPDEQELVERLEQERPARRLSGRASAVVAAAGVLLSLHALRWVFVPMPALAYRASFGAVAVALTLLVYRARPRRDRTARDDPGPADWLAALAALACLLYPVATFDEFIRHAVRPTAADLVAGILGVLLILEACRRTTGWVLPLLCVGFVAYALFGDLIPPGYLLGHRGYDLPRVVGHVFVGTEGVFGVPLEVAATYIVLFSIYGAVLEHSGVARYFIDLSLAAFGRSSTAPGRTVALAGFLLGTVSGSGVATTVTLGSVTWPILRRAGYPPEEGGGILAASGIGAILSPPTLGAAAFIIAELLGISYLRVLLFATIPTFLYYLGILLAIEADSRRFRTRPPEVDIPPLRSLLRFAYHFSSLVAIVVFMALGTSPFMAVVYAIGIAVVQSYLHPSTRLTPKRLWEALASAARGVLPVAATCAAAGIIVAVVTLTGLGLKASSIIVFFSGDNLALTALYSAVAVVVLGLAVPVTASFIIAAVIIGPALTQLGVDRSVAYMFIFYYAVLSEVSPPTALSAVAASAVTGGDTFATMVRVFRYALPAFLVPFAFVLSPNGEALLLQASASTVVWTLLASSLGVCALAIVTGGWVLRRAAPLERIVSAVAALCLLYLEPATVLAGATLLAAALVLHLLRTRRHNRRTEADVVEEVVS